MFLELVKSAEFCYFRVFFAFFVVVAKLSHENLARVSFV